MGQIGATGRKNEVRVQDLVLRLGVALAIGLLVGLERGWRDRDGADGSRTAGLRTFGIFGLLGGLLAAVSAAMAAPLVFAAGFLGFAALLGLFQFHKAEHDENFSATGVMAGLCVFVLGALAVAGDFQVAAAAGAALAAILAGREALHQALQRLSWLELRSALMLAVMTTVVLPLLPDRTLDPWGGFNPREIWFVTVLIATISFLGYIAVRVLGPRRGILVSGLAGALVSSTAVTVAMARLAAQGASARPLAGTAALAAVVSLARVTALVVLLRPEVALQFAPAFLAAGFVFAVGGGLLLMGGQGASAPSDAMRNPFELRALLIFAAAFAIVSTLGAVLVALFGQSGMLIGAGLSGLFDADVAVLSALRQIGNHGPTGQTTEAVALAVLVAVASNAVGRVMLAALAGPRRFVLPLATCTVLAALAGGAVFALI